MYFLTTLALAPHRLFGFVHRRARAVFNLPSPPANYKMGSKTVNEVLRTRLSRLSSLEDQKKNALNLSRGSFPRALSFQTELFGMSTIIPTVCVSLKWRLFPTGGR